MSDSRILFLLADFARNPSLRERFEADALSVLGDYGLSQEQLAVLRSQDDDRIAGTVEKEARDVIRRLRDQPVPQVPWPFHQVKVDSCAPHIGPIGQRISFLIRGAGFAPGAQLVFTNPKVLSPVIAENVAVVTGRDGNSVMTGDAMFVTVASYDVRVINPNGEGNALAGGFEATP